MSSIRELIMGLGRHGSAITVSGRDSPTIKHGLCRVEVLEAVNGRVLEVSSRAKLHDDWDVDLYIVRDDETLADAIATMLVLRGGK